jgi:hypothetical protein
MGGARLRSCGHLVVETLVVFALAVSLPLVDTNAASAATFGSAPAYEGPTDAVHQSARMADAMHRKARLAKAGSALHVGDAAPAVSVRVTRDAHLSLSQPSGAPVNWHRWMTAAALGRAPPA